MCLTDDSFILPLILAKPNPTKGLDAPRDPKASPGDLSKSVTHVQKQCTSARCAFPEARLSYMVKNKGCANPKHGCERRFDSSNLVSFQKSVKPALNFCFELGASLWIEAGEGGAQSAFHKLGSLLIDPGAFQIQPP